MRDVALLTLVCSALLGQDANFKIDVQLVRLLVTVKNPAGDLVGSLESRDFELFDSGVKQSISVFEHQTTQPLSVTLLIDTSGSTAKDLKYETVSLGKFLTALVKEGNPDDAASLYSFNDQVTLLNSYTRRLGRLEISETSVAVVVTSPHRRAAFEAALEGINRLKKVVPVWKKEYFVDGEVWVDGEWDDAVVKANP
jgi:VWFA-related protein